MKVDNITLMMFVLNLLNFVLFLNLFTLVVKGMGKLSIPVVPGNLISLPNFLGIQSVQ